MGQRKLQWKELSDDDGNSYYEASSPYHNDGAPIMWRLRQKLRDNRIMLYEDHDTELVGKYDEPLYWEKGHLTFAKDHIAKMHTEIIDEIKNH